MSVKNERVLDPIHNIIVFDKNDDLDPAMWKVIQTEPFQRLRRIKQLGFSELTFPGATHSRYAHSIGVYHTARKLMKVIKKQSTENDFDEEKAKVALAAALVHDLGHGMFSHAFEKVGKNLNLTSAHHEKISERLILEDPIAEVLHKARISPSDVATVIGRKGPADLYDAVVSSQFDADRLDYMRRDRFMAGVQSGGIDFPWLLNNLEIGEIRSNSEESGVGTDQEPDKVKTFVLGPKAILGAEAYILALFHLYPTLYLHKTTRAAEMVFETLLTRVLKLIREQDRDMAGLFSTKHPFVGYAVNPEDMTAILALDDTVLWGSLNILNKSNDKLIARCSDSLLNRNLPKTNDKNQKIDFKKELDAHIKNNMDGANDDDIKEEITQIVANIKSRIDEWNKENATNGSHIFLDVAERNPYSMSIDKGELDKIHIKTSEDKISDIRLHSPVIKSLRKFKITNAYAFDDDSPAKNFLEKIISDMKGNRLT